ncbi:MAG TPA: DUF2807 domain-containing protein, partial [Phnomibacter sp.]|nr:DUF2807 domain-containing protein [Phnomibacter sp.]
NIEHVDIRPGAQRSVKARLSEAQFDNLTVQVVNDTLYIALAEKDLIARSQHTVHIVMPQLQSAWVKGNGTAQVSGFDQTGMITLQVAGTKVLQASVRTDVLRVKATDQTRAVIKGQATRLRAYVHQKAIVDGFQFPVQHADAIGYDHGKIFTVVSNTLTASAIDNAQIFFKGKPANRFTSETENGKVHDLE